MRLSVRGQYKPKLKFIYRYFFARPKNLEFCFNQESNKLLPLLQYGPYSTENGTKLKI